MYINYCVCEKLKHTFSSPLFKIHVSKVLYTYKIFIYIYICICTSLHMHLHIHMHIRYTKNTTISSVHVILEPLGAIRCPGAAMAGKIETAGES